MDENTKAELYKMYARAMKMMPGSSQQKELVKKIGALRKKLGMNEERDYKAEYKKFQSSTKSKKYRAELNKYNRKKGTYGNGDGKDASHKGGKIVGFEKESTNRGRAEKSRLKKESTLNENPAAMAAAQAMVKIKMKNPKTGKENSAVSALKDKDNPNHKKAKGIFAKLKDRFSKKKDDKKAAPTKQTKSDADFYKRQYTGESVNEAENKIADIRTILKTKKGKRIDSIFMDVETAEEVMKHYKSLGSGAKERLTKQKIQNIVKSVKKANESINEDDLGLTYKKGKTIKVTHKKSGKSLIIVDKPAVRKEYEKRGFFAESVNEGFSSSDIKKAIAIAKKMGGNMTGAVKTIEKMKRGLSKDKQVAKALQTANESINEAGNKSIDAEELLKFLQKRFKMSRKDAIASMKKHNMDVSSIKKESVTEGQKRQASDIINKFDKAYLNFAKEVRDVIKMVNRSTNEKTDGKIIDKAYSKHLIPLDKLMQSWSRGQQENPHIKESDLGLTYKKGKTVKVKHKTSGKELVVVDKPAVRKEYEKIGYFAESVNEAKSKTMTTIGSIIGKKQAQKISGVLVDMQTALVIMKVWNALGSSNRAKFEKLPIKQMANVAWKLMK